MRCVKRIETENEKIRLKKKGNIIMTVLSVPDMHCEHCVKRITDTLNAVNVPFTISLEEKKVTIENDEQVELAISELDDIGFEAQRA